MSEPISGRRPSGALEADVLATLWGADHALTAAEIQRALGLGLAHTTIATILSRLLDKGVVARGRTGRAYAYRPVQDAAGIAAGRMQLELDRHGQDRDTVLARFVSRLDSADEDVLRRLLDENDENDATGGRG